MSGRREEILDAALELADERGLAAVSMRAVADRVGVTPMALYPHVGSKAALLDGMVGRLLGGMAAEQVVYGVITTGAESDLEQVTNIARGMAGRWGMSAKVGRLTAIPSDTQGAYGLSAAPATLDAVDGEARRIVAECYEEACRKLAEHRPRLDALAEALMEHETLDEEAAYRAAGMPRMGRSG